MDMRQLYRRWGFRGRQGYEFGITIVGIIETGLEHPRISNQIGEL